MSDPVLEMKAVSKRFTLHRGQPIDIDVLENVDLNVESGECVVLDGPSGMGKSTLLKLIYGNYRLSSGRIDLWQDRLSRIDLGRASPRELLSARHESIGYVSQFLRAIPRVSSVDVVAEPLLAEVGDSAQIVRAARQRAQDWLSRLQIPRHLWDLAPATFSGGEQQRVNIARGLIRHRRLLLLDEPTASLDRSNTAIVIDLIREAMARGSAVVAIFHDPRVGDLLACRRIDMTRFRSPR